MLKSNSALIRFLLACVMVGAVVGFPRFAFSAEQRVALIIGNSAYPTARLKNPVNDATAMAAKLRALGFDVTLKTDAAQREMTRAISQFGQKLTLGSVGLFYYAGHGVQVRGKNFLIPIDAEIETEGSVRSEAVDVDQLLDQLGPARLSMVILDACRNNPFERRFRGTGSGGLAQIDAPTGTLLAYATAPGKVASDGTGANGLYTEALLKALDTPGLKVEDVFKQVRINVLKASDNLQTPWESSSLTGEFYFRPDNKAAVEKEQFQQAVKERAELQKKLEAERKKRDKDAELVRVEMEKLRAELQKIRAEAVAAQLVAPTVATGITATATKPAAAPAQQPQQVATATPPTAPPAASPAPPEQSVQIAIVSPPGPAKSTPPATAVVSPPPNTPAASGEWAQRFALLEKFRGQLTFSKAVAILLDLNAADELTLLLTHEAEIKRMAWSNAYAIGIDKSGYIIWGGGRKWRVSTDAAEAALEYCVRVAGDVCKVVMVNGEFQQKDFLEMAKQLGGQNVAAVRQAYVQNLTKKPTESEIMITTPGVTRVYAIGFSSIRK